MWVCNCYRNTSQEVSAAPIDVLSFPALLFDPAQTCHPIVGTSKLFRSLVGLSHTELMDTSFGKLLDRVPVYLVSRSAMVNLADFCKSSIQHDVYRVGEVSILQTMVRADSSYFMAHLSLGLCVIGRVPFVLVALQVAGEGTGCGVGQEYQISLKEQGLKLLENGRRDLAGVNGPPLSLEDSPVAFRFYSERLQEHCLLLGDGTSAARREADVLPAGCMLISDRPLQKTSCGLSFSLRVDRLEPTFIGLPVLGFTRCAPRDVACLYPTNVRCFAQSVLIGSHGATASDAAHHHVMGIKKPQQHEIRTWEPAADSKALLDRSQLQENDVVECRYTWEGRLQTFHNGVLLMDFDVARPLQADVQYFAIVDVCLTAACVSLVPRVQPPGGSDGSTESGGSISRDLLDEEYVILDL
eukprot:CAMPEP_0194493706 /NCGR_PEP_ID=MMETSP0253-20130528/11843_1 /TAXON_ID=2966 /ORGANISM="Noctiluca scintillans" /LENGTH=411 /DNA_ID=CAMNT_0039334723 /DNA_START=1 /DNA_END=1236 /DNA_ORIENTATION=+